MLFALSLAIAVTIVAFMWWRRDPRVVGLKDPTRTRVNATTPPREPASADEARAYVGSIVETMVRGGFDTVDDIRDSAREAAADEGLESPDDEVNAMMVAAFARHASEQATWPPETDCDRLDRAFASLEHRGIVARQNFTCCQTCGNAEIGDEIAKHAGPTPVRGYTFFHQQDTQRAVEGGGVYLSFGSISDDEKVIHDVAREICSSLTDAGLTPDWIRAHRHSIANTHSEPLGHFGSRLVRRRSARTVNPVARAAGGSRGEIRPLRSSW